MLGGLRHSCELERPELEAGSPTQRERERDLQRCGRGETRSDRKVGGDSARESDRTPAEAGQLCGDRLDVPAPTVADRPLPARVDLDRRKPVGGERDRP
jgi:hypothetical protein